MSPLKNAAVYICSKCVNMSRFSKTQDRGEKKLRKFLHLIFQIQRLRILLDAAEKKYVSALQFDYLCYFVAL